MAGSTAVPHSEPAQAPQFANGRAGKRDRIIAAALRLFARQPYQEVTMDSVARLAEVAKGTLYLYFDSKEALYLGILTDGFEKASQNNADDPQAQVAERLHRAIASSIEFYDSHRDFLQLLATEEPRIAAARSRVIQEFRQRGFDFFSSLIEEGMARGVFRRADPRVAALTIIGAIRSLLLYYDHPHDGTELSQELSRMVLEGLTAGARNHRKAHTK
jgi:TetR/AcrR family transcriptional regulator, regulator of autoinduction and epiphytic fitness